LQREGAAHGHVASAMSTCGCCGCCKEYMLILEDGGCTCLTDLTSLVLARRTVSNALHGLQQVTSLHSAYLKFKEDSACVHMLCEDQGDKTRHSWMYTLVGKYTSLPITRGVGKLAPHLHF